MDDVRILAQDGHQFFRIGKLAQIDAGYGLLLYIEVPQRKQSIHSDGSHWDRVVGFGGLVQPMQDPLPLKQRCTRSLPFQYRRT